MKIFLSYRREDAGHAASRLHQLLSDHFGASSIIFDFESIQIGADFKTYLDEQLAQCDCLLAIVGKSWLDTLRERADQDEQDYVRYEIQAAMKRDIPIIPVLVDNSLLPTSDNLPEELKALANNQTAVLSLERFSSDTTHLIQRLEKLNSGDNSPEIGNAKNVHFEFNKKREEVLYFSIVAISAVFIFLLVLIQV